MNIHTPATADTNHSFSIDNGTLKVEIPGSNGNGSEYALMGNVLTINNGFTGSITATYEFTTSNVRDIDFVYDHNGLRTQKKVTENGVTTTYEYMLHGKLVTHMTKKVNGTLTDTLHFFYSLNALPVFVEYSNKKYAFCYNLHGDVVGLLDSNGMLVVEYKYDSWGRLLTTSGTLAGTLGVYNPFRYRGYVFDEETGLYYLRKRYYSPDLSRFINEDSNVGQHGALLAHNLFCYCANLPMNGVDYNGSETLWMAKLGAESELIRAVKKLSFVTRVKHWPIRWDLGTILAKIETNLCVGLYVHRIRLGGGSTAYYNSHIWIFPLLGI